MKKPQTELCSHSLTGMTYRDQDLIHDLLGKKTFVEVLFIQITGRTPRPIDIKIIDAILITLMEHGLTPSAISTRLTYMSAPESLQGAVAAGLQAVGSQFVGTMENCSKLLERILAAPDQKSEIDKIIAEYQSNKSHIPGFGHHLHKPDDPRSKKLFEIALSDAAFDRSHIDALMALGKAIDKAYKKHITINATGAVAALLGGLGIPTDLMRGFAVISRAAGLVSHIAEEQRYPSARYIWDTIDKDIPFVMRPTK